MSIHKVKLSGSHKLIDRLANNPKGIFSWTLVISLVCKSAIVESPIPFLPVVDDDQRILVG
jgi:hypothetical protein